MIYFTADNHFGHNKIIEFCDRPFKDVQEMTDEMIERWNMTVNMEDTVYIVGDFIFGGSKFARGIIDQLVGRKVLIMGNHDHRNRKPKKWLDIGIDEVYENRLMDFGDKEALFPVIICHFPYVGTNHDHRVFDGQLKDDGKILIHGHVHEKWKVQRNMINVGVDQWDFYPVSKPKIELMVRALA